MIFDVLLFFSSHFYLALHCTVLTKTKEHCATKMCVPTTIRLLCFGFHFVKSLLYKSLTMQGLRICVTYSKYLIKKYLIWRLLLLERTQEIQPFCIIFALCFSFSSTSETYTISSHLFECNFCLQWTKDLLTFAVMSAAPSTLMISAVAYSSNNNSSSYDNVSIWPRTKTSHKTHKPNWGNIPKNSKC